MSIKYAIDKKKFNNKHFLLVTRKFDIFEFFFLSVPICFFEIRTTRIFNFGLTVEFLTFFLFRFGLSLTSKLESSTLVQFFEL